MRLRLKAPSNFAGYPHLTTVRGSKDNWEELEITWNTQPEFESIPLDSVTVYCCGNVYMYDVTAYVRDQLFLGDETVSFVQMGANESGIGGLQWWQREGDGVVVNSGIGERPMLLIDTDQSFGPYSWEELKLIFGD